MTRRVCLSAPPPDGARIDGVRSLSWHGLPRLGESVVVEVYGNRRDWWLARVCEVDRERETYSVEVTKL